MQGGDKMKLVAVTSCPNGIAHTYMAAENLEKAATKMGIEIKVETQGGVGVENALTEKEIREADGVIIAADKAVDKTRFIGKALILAGVQDGIRKPDELIRRIEKGEVKTYRGTGREHAQTSITDNNQNAIYRHLMNGVSFMVPFIVVGGLLIAIALTLGGEPTEAGLQIPEGSIWGTIEAIGGAAFGFMVPILAGYIAYSIADKPGLAPGMIGGFIAANGSFYGSEADAGFLGGIIAGFLAGYVALAIKKIKVSKMIQPIMPIIIIPVFASLIVSLGFVLIIGAPVAQVFEALTSWLEGMQGTSSILLALILGAMIAFDMGGPVNKVAFMFGAAMIAEGNYGIMGPVAAAIAIPPIGMGLATFMFKDKFLPEERETGKASITMGFFGITEGAIPFAAQDPIRVIPSIMVGSMAGAVVAMIGGVGNRVAHGGPIVGLLGAVDNVIMFFIAIIVGSLIVAFMIKVLKKDITTAKLTPVEKKINIPISRIENEITTLESLTDLNLVTVDLKANTRDDAIEAMIDDLYQDGAVTDRVAFQKTIMNRENESTTGIGMNVAIPHGKSEGVKFPRVAFAISKEGIDWSSLDGSLSQLIFMIAVPKEQTGDTHLRILQVLSRKLMDEKFRKQLISSSTKEEAYKLLKEIQ